MTDNESLLNEVNAAGLWFHAKKTRPIRARQVTEPQQIQTLEGTEEVPAGAYLCRGEAGDLWPQSAERLQEKYQATDEVDAEGWRRYVPHPDNQGVLAARVEHPFTVETSWGTLHGKPGDYLGKNFEDRDVAHPSDVWIVDRNLFEATYEPSGA
jgi:hypothetical protein